MSRSLRIIVPIDLFCPYCGKRHVDENRNGIDWHKKAHTTHRCQHCGKDFDVYASGAPEGATKIKKGAGKLCVKCKKIYIKDNEGEICTACWGTRELREKKRKP